MQTTTVTAPALSSRSLDDYVESVRRLRLLSPDEERDLAARWRCAGDVEARAALVLSHQPLVVAVARGFLAYGLPYADLIQEGNVGLMKALQHFDPGRGVRLACYAAHWIRAEIHEYVMANWRLVRGATSRATRKLFFRLREAKAQTQWLSEAMTARLARELDVTPVALRKMETYLYGSDVPLPEGRGAGTNDMPAHRELPDTDPEPCQALEDAQWQALQCEALRQAIAALTERDREIIRHRWLGHEQCTLREVGEQLGVTSERARQLETQALKRLARSMRWRLACPEGRAAHDR